MQQPINNGVLESPLDLNGYGFVNIGGLLGTFEVPLSFSFPLSRTDDTNVVSIPAATSSVNGYLSSTDWSTFNNKVTSTETVSVDGQVVLFNGTTGKSIRKATGTGIAKVTNGVFNTVAAPTGALVGDDDSQILRNKTLSLGTLVSTIGLNFERPSGGGILSLLALSGASSLNIFLPAVAGTLITSDQAEVPLTFTSPLSRSVNTISIPAATSSVNGYLSSADWTTFNSKATSAQGTKADSAVQSVSIATANGVSGSSSGGTTPALTLVLGAITPSSINGNVLATGSLRAPATIDLELVGGVKVSGLTYEGASIILGAPGAGNLTDLSLINTGNIFISVLAGNGFVKTSGGTGQLSVDTTAYAPLASPTFTGTVGLPSGQALSGPNITDAHLSGGTLYNSTGGGDVLLTAPSILGEISVILPSIAGTLALVSQIPTSADYIPADWLDTDPTLAADDDSLVPSQKAVKAYVDANAGTGTVTGFSAGDLSPLFTTSEATVTTTPALTFSLSTHAANTVFAGPTTGSAAAPTFRALVSSDIPTLNQDTTGSAAKWTTARNLAGNSVDGSAAVAFANKFIVQGTADAGLSAAQFLGALGTGIVKNTTTTGVLSIAVAGDFPTLNQNTSGSALSIKANGGTGVMQITGPGALSTRVKTVTNANDTILELSGSYTPVGTWTSMTLVTPALGTPSSCILTNATGLPSSGILGTATNNNAAAGSIGEYVSASVAVGSATALTTATPKTVTSISLTAGDWDITAIGAITGASTGTEFDVAIGATTNSMTGTVLGDSRCQTPTVSLAGADASLMIPNFRVSLASTTTYYLIVQETFTIGSPAAYGRISARRVR